MDCSIWKIMNNLILLALLLVVIITMLFCLFLLKLTSHTTLCAATQQSNMTRRRGFIAYKTPQNWRGKTERADLYYIITLTWRQTTDDESIFQLQAPSFSGAIHTTRLKTQALRSRNIATQACENIPTANTQGATPWKGRMIVCVDAQLRNCATDVECGASHLQPIVLQQ